MKQRQQLCRPASLVFMRCQVGAPFFAPCLSWLWCGLIRTSLIFNQYTQPLRLAVQICQLDQFFLASASGSLTTRCPLRSDVPVSHHVLLRCHVSPASCKMPLIVSRLIFSSPGFFRTARCNSVSDHVPVPSSSRSGVRLHSAITCCRCAPSYVACRPAPALTYNASSPSALNRSTSFPTPYPLFRPLDRAPSANPAPAASTKRHRARCTVAAAIAWLRAIRSSSAFSAVLKDLNASRFCLLMSLAYPIVERPTSNRRIGGARVLCRNEDHQAFGGRRIFGRADGVPGESRVGAAAGG